MEQSKNPNPDMDPTAIPIELDPLKQRMSGIAYHGNTPFDVPYISNIKENLYQGGCEGGFILPHDIDKVLSLYKWEKYYIDRDDVERLEIEMYDSEDQGFEQVEELSDLVNQWLDDGNKVLVHCQAGLNRSSLVAARALMKREGWTGDETIKFLRKQRSKACLCNPAFEEYVRSFDQ